MGQGAAIEGVRAIGGNFGQRVRQFRLDDEVAELFADEDAGAEWVPRQHGAVGFGDFRVAMGGAVAVPGGGDGRLHQLRPGQLAVGGVHGAQPGEAAGHGDAARAGDIEPAGEHGGAGGGRGGAGGVDHHALAVDQDVIEAVAADAGHHRVHHAIGEADRHRRIHRVATGAQHVQPGLGGQRVIGADGAVAAHDQRAMGAGDQIHRGGLTDGW